MENIEDRRELEVTNLRHLGPVTDLRHYGRASEGAFRVCHRRDHCLADLDHLMVDVGLVDHCLRRDLVYHYLG